MYDNEFKTERNYNLNQADKFELQHFIHYDCRFSVSFYLP